MQTERVACASCGAPINIPDDIDHLNCTYCGASLVVRRGEGFVSTKLVEQVKEAIDGASRETKQSLYQLQLQQQLSTTQIRLSNLQSEIRTLQRLHKTRQVDTQLRELRWREAMLISEIEGLHQQLTGGEGSARLDPKIERAYQEVIAGSYGNKDWTISFMLCLLLGTFGAHRFYSGHILIAIIQFLTFGGLGVWWLIDLFLIGTGRFRDEHGLLLANPQTRFGRSCATSMITFLIIAVSCTLISTPIETRLLGLVNDPDRYGPIATAGLVIGILVGIGVFIYIYQMGAKYLDPIKGLWAKSNPTGKNES